MVERFRLAIEQAMGKALDEQLKARRELQKELKEGFVKKPRAADQKEVSRAGIESKMVKGYKMEEVKAMDETTELTSSGVQWFASLFVILLIGLFIYGVKRVK